MGISWCVFFNRCLDSFSFLEEEVERKVFFFFSFSTTGFLYLELSVRRFEVCAPKFIVQNDSTANSGLLTVLLLISERSTISASPRGRSGEFTNAGGEELAYTEPGSVLYFSQVIAVPADHTAFHSSYITAVDALIFVHRLAYLNARSL